MFNKKVVLITGASSGIGRGFAEELHKRGANLVLVARRVDLLKEIADRHNTLRPDSCKYIQADISGSDIGAILSFIKENHIDFLVNNAGRGSFGYFESLVKEEETNMVSLNVLAPMWLTHAVIPQMKERRSGGIICTSSLAAFQPLPLMATYAATKAFNLSHTLALRNELQDFGIRVLAVCPGPVHTEFGGVARVPGTMTGLNRDNVSDVVAQSLIAFEKNKAFVIPGKRAKFMYLLLKIFPQTVNTNIVGKILKNVLRKSLGG